ncbi:MAG: hypothetical protein ACE366_23905 [Bradymonadia bacterium]
MITRTLRTARETVSAFLNPVHADKAGAAQRTWDNLPPDLQVPNQVLGKQSAGCAATYGVLEACDFKCTACYLADVADDTPPLPMHEVKAQLDQIREHLGPWGSTQITAGEVTLLPCDELIEILRYCHEIQLTPMLMTNGQTILKDPTYLERLLVEGHLRKVAFHIDTTQKGRLGLRARDTETDIHWIRDAFANLVRQTRKKTGINFEAAGTFTVTEDNFEQVPEVLRWFIDNSDAFYLFSLQPTADVGRTRESEQVNQREALWNQVREGAGLHLNRHAMRFGHPQCNSVSMFWVIKYEDAEGNEQTQLMEVTREGVDKDRVFFERLISDGLAGFSPDGEAGHLVLARLMGRFAQSPRYLWSIPTFCASRVWEERAWVPEFLKAVAARRRWRVSPFGVVVHNFMSAHELETEEGKARLDACSFKVPIDGEMVSMCRLNGTDMRRKQNLKDQDRLVSIKEPIRRAG